MTNMLFQKACELPEICDALEKQAKEGSCKTCKWCGVIPPEDDPYIPGATHWCMIQGARGLNAIHFRPSNLDGGAYPWRCDVGSWHNDSGEPIPYCLAYQPGYAGVSCEDHSYKEAARNHWQFMDDLCKAMYLYAAIHRGDFAKLSEGINAATDSLPTVLTQNPYAHKE